MLLSIVVPVYNVEQYLTDCINSIVSQISTISDVELILVDDGSTDQSSQICDRYKEQYPNLLKVFHNQNQGLLLTRLYGYRHASGEYILNCDSDDTLEMSAIKKIIEVINKHRPDVILYNAYVFDNFMKKVYFNNIFGMDDSICLNKREVIKEFISSDRILSI